MARRRHKRGSGCSRKLIRFRTRRGKTVSFYGRPGGMTTAGGVCKPKRRKTSHLSRYKSAFRAAVRACKRTSHTRRGKHGVSAFNRCVGAKVRRAG